MYFLLSSPCDIGRGGLTVRLFGLLFPSLTLLFSGFWYHGKLLVREENMSIQHTLMNIGMIINDNE